MEGLGRSHGVVPRSPARPTTFSSPPFVLKSTTILEFVDFEPKKCFSVPNFFGRQRPAEHPQCPYLRLGASKSTIDPRLPVID